MSLHEQIALTDLRITCDAKIAHVIRGLNGIPGVVTTTSCYDVLDRAGGYVVIRTSNRRFLNHLKTAGYSVDSFRNNILIDIDPIIEPEFLKLVPRVKLSQ